MPRSLCFYVHASHTCEQQRLEHAEPLVHHHLDAQLLRMHYARQQKYNYALRPTMHVNKLVVGSSAWLVRMHTATIHAHRCYCNTYNSCGGGMRERHQQACNPSCMVMTSHACQVEHRHSYIPPDLLGFPGAPKGIQQH